MRIYERIRKYIDENGLRLRFVAEKAGIQEKRFYRLLSGGSNLTADEYELIARNGLNLDPAYFFNEIFLDIKNKNAG